MERSHWLFVEGTRAMLTSWLAYKNTSSLEHSIRPAGDMNVCVSTFMTVNLIVVETPASWWRSRKSRRSQVIYNHDYLYKPLWRSIW